MDIKKSNHVRPVDEAASKSYSWLGSKVIFIKSATIKTWKGTLVVAFFAGSFASIIWSISLNIHESSYAGSIINVNNAKIKSSEKDVYGEMPEHTGELKDIAQDHILVKFKKSIDKEKQNKVLERNNLKEKDEIKQIGVKIISIPLGKSPKEIVENLKVKEKDSIEYVEIDALISPSFIPNDPQYTSQWHHSKINSPLAWDSVNGSGITIAILDTGVDCAHPDLAASCVAGWNVVSNNSDTTDIYGHGTPVAGTAAAIGNNNNQVAGEAYAAKIMPVRITNDSAGGYAYWSDIANGIVYAADHGAKIASNSYASSEGSSVRSAAQYMKNKGGLVVVGAGNTGGLTGLGDVPEIIIASATGSSDARASWSSYGDNVDVSAPGVSILTTTRGGGTNYWSGTSFSTPLTAGTLALIWSVNPAFAPNQVQQIIFDTVVDLGVAGWDQYYGWGRINAGAAVTLAKNTITSGADIIPPTTSITSPANGATVSDATTISALASDSVGVTKVELWKDGNLFYTDTIFPYDFIWDTTKETNGSHTLQSKAYDAASNIGSSAIITVTTNNIIIADTQIPIVSIISPVDGSTISAKGNLYISVSATDNVGVAQINIFFDGVIRKTCLAVTTCSVSINTRKISSGAHTISATASDAAGNAGNAKIDVTK